MSLQGYATSVTPVNEIISAYAAAPYEPIPRASPSPWVVYGSFTVPENVTARLSILAINSGPAVLSVRLFDPTALSSVLVPATGKEAATVSGTYQLLTGKVYQIAVQFLGTEGKAAVRTVSLSAP
jgi:hypothetical protein